MSGIQAGTAPENGVSSEVGVDLEQVVIFDTTMRDGEQSPGCSMNLDEKLQLARQLERLNVDILRPGFLSHRRGTLPLLALFVRKYDNPLSPP